MVQYNPKSFITVERIIASPGPYWTRQAEAHTWHEFICVLRGRYTCRYNKRPLRGQTGSIFFYPAGCLHHPTHARDGSVELLLVRCDAQRRLALATQVDDDQARLRTLATWMLDQKGRRLDCSFTLFIEEYRALSKAHTDQQSLDLVDKAIAAMPRCYRVGRGIDHLCKQLGVSRPTLYRAFQQRHHCSPQRYYMQLRADTARQLVEQQGWSLIQAANEIGLSSGKSVRRLLNSYH